ncbi:serine hydrolase domain-containing protein [Alkalibacter saccharofermentans]|uniref:CubicO group peptidase, beta-lactamase class C family n=1 Tax=Alkalibacter saccharofermentans DSM 14828 TaxID=1120975 RepID=A0A1M5A4D7_9FIRM|nr:serine hydrolase domain-containing protein [Alkalibacter saccharofermentans]SHF24957.1 CubicO group peptidase, beta-lactamase class C family [Alkalibacter saccharofermentans DSM 14828]
MVESIIVGHIFHVKRGMLVKKKGKKILHILIVVILAIVLIVYGFVIYGNYQMSKIPGLSFEDCLNYTMKGNDNAIITVGIIKDGQATYTVYGKDTIVMPQVEHTYEIGSLTKTFTATLIKRAIIEGKINLDDTIDKHLEMPVGNTYPTIEQLLTHTSGYKSHYFELPMIGNFFGRRNDFYGITDDMLLKSLSKVSVTNETAKFNYSNFGYATLGLVLEAVYDRDYLALVNVFASEELGLENTHISDRQGDLKQYWDWNANDVYLSAGGLTSTISDMLDYAQLQLAGKDIFASCHDSLAVINSSTKAYSAMGINMDEIGAGWIIDRENDIIWHNGGTGDYNCYLGFCPKTETAVVILSNLAPNYRIPATVMGVKLLKQYLE